MAGRVPRSLIEDAAKIIIQCRKTHPFGAIDNIPRPLTPMTIEHGYEIAHAVANQSKLAVGGYKAGATNKCIMVGS